jgi:hypothetical protein
MDALSLLITCHCEGSILNSRQQLLPFVYIAGWCVLSVILKWELAFSITRLDLGHTVDISEPQPIPVTAHHLTISSMWTEVPTTWHFCQCASNSLVLFDALALEKQHIFTAL